MIRSRRFWSVLAVVALSFPGCAQDGGDTTEEASPPVEASPAVTPLSNGELAEIHGTEDVSSETELEVEMDDYYFEPTILMGKAGQELTLKFRNDGKELHSFTLQDQGIDADVNPAQTGVEAKVKFPASGGLVFICKYHAAQNMRGELTTS